MKIIYVNTPSIDELSKRRNSSKGTTQTICSFVGLLTIKLKLYMLIFASVPNFMCYSMIIFGSFRSSLFWPGACFNPGSATATRSNCTYLAVAELAPVRSLALAAMTIKPLQLTALYAVSKNDCFRKFGYRRRR